jgi:type VI secretion system protein ImpA
MPLNVDELLAPIPGDNPSGADLRYDPIYEKIKEARRQEDEVPQGQWARDIKVADWPLVVKLGTEILTTKSKDLQIAAWLTEALIKQDGFSGLRSGLQLMEGLIEKYWDTLWPEVEDGDAELRAAPLSWVGLKLDVPVKSVPLVREGYDFFKHTESQMTVGYEAACEGDSKKLAARQEKINEGKLCGEEWDKAFEATPKPFYKQITADLDGSLKRLAALDQLGDKFGDAAPGYGTLKKAVEEVQYVAVALLKAKLAVDPDPIELEPAEGSAERAGADLAAGPLTAEPVSREDAVGRIAMTARYLRGLEPSNPAAYLLLRGFRWGEVRACNQKLEPRLLQAPTTQLRSQLKLLLLDQKWPALLEAGENAMAQPCGRGWLDLQRYTISAVSHLGPEYAPVETALRGALKAYLADVPQIAEMTMMDDTPTANAETQEWIAQDLKVEAAAAEPVAEAEGSATEDVDGSDALALARGGRAQQAVAMLKEQLAMERTLRGRFRRRTQLAAVLVEAGQDGIAQPILEDLVAQIDNYKLEEWESGEMVAEPLVLLCRVLLKLEGDFSTRQALYLRVCRLDPIQALKCPL